MVTCFYVKVTNTHITLTEWGADSESFAVNREINRKKPKIFFRSSYLQPTKRPPLLLQHMPYLSFSHSSLWVVSES
jgi:hypothetical protein